MKSHFIFPSKLLFHLIKIFYFNVTYNFDGMMIECLNVNNATFNVCSYYGNVDL